MYETFVEREFSSGSLEIIEQADVIIKEYQAAGFTLTLRQLYYQFVARDIIANKQIEYKRLGSIINDARLAGLIDWAAIEDRTRNLHKYAMWNNPQDIMSAVANQYTEDLWAGQKTRVEVWIEKDALIGVIEPVCQRWQIPYFACRGYSSQSEQYEAGKRFARRYDRHGQSTLVLHLGDHDPSGIDMSRDNLERLRMFAGDDALSTDLMVVDLKRLALNYDQVEAYRPPPNPAKMTDSRAKSYVRRFGASSWELDALDPKVIDTLIADAVADVIDKKAWDKAQEHADTNRQDLIGAADNWEDVVAFLNDK